MENFKCSKRDIENCVIGNIIYQRVHVNDRFSL